MNKFSFNFLIFTLFVFIFKTASSLDCYSCSNEHHNWMSCTKNIVQCKSFQDACVSYTSFHRFIDYHPRSERWHNISKGCDTMAACERRAAAVNDILCDRSSFHEWACIECCRGDLCNYFVTLGSPSLFNTTSMVVMAMCFFLCRILSLY